VRRKDYLIALVLFVVFLPFALGGCGDDADESFGTEGSTSAVASIQTCISQGGTPVFTTTSHGSVRFYLGCIAP
jgi:hypothetical protein